MILNQKIDKVLGFCRPLTVPPFTGALLSYHNYFSLLPERLSNLNCIKPVDLLDKIRSV